MACKVTYALFENYMIQISSSIDRDSIGGLVKRYDKEQSTKYPRTVATMELKPEPRASEESEHAVTVSPI
jgi:hypothetical protein